VLPSLTPFQKRFWRSPRSDLKNLLHRPTLRSRFVGTHSRTPSSGFSRRSSKPSSSLVPPQKLRLPYHPARSAFCSRIPLPLGRTVSRAVQNHITLLSLSHPLPTHSCRSDDQGIRPRNKTFERRRTIRTALPAASPLLPRPLTAHVMACHAMPMPIATHPSPPRSRRWRWRIGARQNGPRAEPSRRSTLPLLGSGEQTQTMERPKKTATEAAVIEADESSEFRTDRGSETYRSAGLRRCPDRW
jgi:hypothetical protein